MGSLNYAAVLVAAVASFIFGGIWYSAFSARWLEAVGRTPESMRDKASIGLYLLAFGAQVVMAWLFAGVLVHLAMGGLPVNLRNGVISAVFLWFGFVMTTMVVNYAFHGARQILTLIDGGHWLGVLLVQGAVLGWWGVGGHP